ncbi:hypothetical protein FKP32DRAFT_1088264 [Trametes sanguinea]|nr:hypothetical protein FKP32DRAFT_1088264 [Trametes sanguinea]
MLLLQSGWMTRLCQHYKSRSRPHTFEAGVRALSERYNSASFIYRRLPPEILLRVSAYLRPSRRHDICLAHVYRVWRSLLQHCPSFWSDMLPLVDPTGTKWRPHPTDWFLTFLQLAARSLFPIKLLFFSSVVYSAVAPYLPHITSLVLAVRPVDVLRTLRQR